MTNTCYSGENTLFNRVNLDVENVSLEDIVNSVTKCSSKKMLKKIVKNIFKFDLQQSAINDEINLKDNLEKLNAVLQELNFNLLNKNGVFKIEYLGPKEQMLKAAEELESQLFLPENRDLLYILDRINPDYDIYSEAEKYAQPGIFDKLKSKLATVKSKLFGSAPKSKPRKWGWFEKRAAKKMPPLEPMGRPEQRILSICWIDNGGKLIDIYSKKLPKPGSDEDILAGMYTAIQSFVQDSYKLSGGIKEYTLKNGNKVTFASGDESFIIVEYETKGKSLDILDAELPRIINTLENYIYAPPAFYKLLNGLKTYDLTKTGLEKKVDPETHAGFLRKGEKLLNDFKKTPIQMSKGEEPPIKFIDFVSGVLHTYSELKELAVNAYNYYQYTIPHWQGLKEVYQDTLAEFANEIRWMPTKQKRLEYEKKIEEYHAKIDEEVKKYKRGMRATGASVIAVLAAAFAGLSASDYEPASHENSAPVIGDILDQVWTAGHSAELQFQAFDADDALTHHLNFENNGTKLPINPVTGLLKIPAVPEAWLGTSILNYSVDDGHHHTAYKLFNLTVKRPNATPVVDFLDVKKDFPYLFVNASGSDPDNAVISALEIFIDNEFYKAIPASTIQEIINLKIKRLDAGTHEVRVRAQDAADSGLYSKFLEKEFEISGKPKITNVSLEKDNTDNPFFLVKALSESSLDIATLEAMLDGTNISNKIDLPSKGNDISQKIGLDLNGLPISEYSFSFSVANDDGNVSEPAYAKATPFDDPIVTNMNATIDMNDTLKLEFSAYDEEGKLDYASISSTTPTPITAEKTQAPSNTISITGFADLSGDTPGIYKILGIAKDTKNAEANASATIVVKDDAPTYVYTINPQSPANNASVSISGYDKDTLEDKITMDVEKDGKIIDEREKALDSKYFNGTWEIDFTHTEPGTAYFTIKVVPKPGQNSTITTLLDKIPFTILNDPPEITSTDIYYNPVNRTLEISGAALDIDNDIVAGNYTLVNKLTGQFTNGTLSGNFNNKTIAFSASAKITSGLPDGDYWANITVMDASGNVTILSRDTEINNTFRVVSIHNPDENATEPIAFWNQAERTAYVILTGNNTMNYKRVANFYNITTPGVRIYLEQNLKTLFDNGTFKADEPFLTANNLNSIISLFDEWTIGKEGIWTTDFYTSYEWLRWEILNNDSLGIPLASKEKWTRVYALPINNHNDQHFLTLINCDENGDGSLDDSKEKMIYANVGIPQNQWDNLILNYYKFASYYTDGEARNRTEEAMYDSKDIGWRYGYYDGIDSLFGFRDSQSAKYAIDTINRYGDGVLYKQLEDYISNTLLSIHAIRGMDVFKDKTINIYMPSYDKVEFWASG